jgi:hypothetical protein
LAPDTLKLKLHVIFSHPSIDLAQIEINLFLLIGLRKIEQIAKKVKGTVKINIPIWKTKERIIVII